MSKNENKQKNQMRHGPMGGFANDKPKDFKKTIKTLLTYLSHYKISIAIVIIFSIGSAVFSIVGPKILGKATTEIFNGLIGKITSSSTGINFDKIGSILLTLLGLYIISMIFSYVQGFIMTGVTQDLTFNLRNEISKKLHKIPLSYYEKNTTGEILSRVTNDVDTLSQALDQSLTQFLSSIFMLIGVVVMMFSISVSMTFLALIIIPISMLLISFVVKKSQKYFKAQQDYLGDINGQIEENYSGEEIVNTFNATDSAIEEFNKTNNKLYKSAWKSQFFSGMMYPIMQFIGNFGYVVVSIFGGYLVIKKKIEVGDIVSFTQYIRNFTQPIAQIAQMMTMLQSMTAASERIFEFLAVEEETADKESEINVNKLKGNITFKDVNFGYNKNKTIINDFSLQAHAGQKIAIVGPTGAGKTTLVKLLMRFYDVNSGKIMIDNIDIRDLKRNDLRDMFGMVLQDTWLSYDTIRENIRYGKLNAKDEEVHKAAVAARVDHFVKTLPEGYDMVINEESDNISEGQKQLLTIARVILKNPKILILDEATSSVDTRMEILIQNAMDKLMEGRTSFIIAHRLSTIRNADLILVMNNGDIVEQGTHEELLKKKGFYANLYNSQFEEV